MKNSIIAVVLATIGLSAFATDAVKVEPVTAVTAPVKVAPTKKAVKPVKSHKKVTPKTEAPKASASAAK